MSELFLIRSRSGLVPADEKAETKLQAWRMGDVLRVKATKPRNGANHRRFFKLLQVCVDNMPEPITVDALLVLLKYRMGYVETIVDPATGKVFYTPKSIDFASLDEPEFRAWYSDASQIICREYLRCSEADLMNYVGLM